MNGPQCVDGKVSKALGFDGVDDYVRIPSAPILKYTGGDFTMSGWLNIDPTETGAGYVFSKPWNGSGEYNYLFYLNMGVGIYGNPSGVYVNSASSLSKGRWYYITAVFVGSSKTIRIYFDGELNKEATHSITNYNPTYGDVNIPLTLMTLYPYGSGWTGNTSFSVQGILDEPRVYNRALSDQEIKALYEATK